MEQLAHATRHHSDRIERVSDEYEAFECVESRLFTIPMVTDTDQSLLQLLMSPKASDAVIEAALDRQAVGLLSVCVAVGGQPPVIAAVRGGAAETVASRLDRKLKDLMASVKAKTLGPSLLHDDLGLQRPCIVFDTN